MRMVMRCTAAALVLMVAACGSSNASDKSGSSNGGTTMSDSDLLSLGKQLAQCYRDNGVAEMPEPYVENGKLKMPTDKMDAVESKYSEAKLNQVEEACKSIANKVPQGALGDSDDDPKLAGPQDVPALRKYSQCMRDNGVPEWPDPNADGTFKLQGTGLDTENSQRMTDAIAKCKQYWSGTISGGATGS